MNTAIIIQARMNSKRLPGKSLKKIGRIPLIQHVYNRLGKVAGIDNILLATSEESTDDALAEYALKKGITFFRGSLNNVQNRFFEAARSLRAERIIRVTGDNPFISPELINIMLDAFDKEKVDYIGYSRCICGIGAEVFSFDALKRAVSVSSQEYDFEHVTPPFYQKKEKFSTLALTAPDTFCADGLSLTVDDIKDFNFAEKVYAMFGAEGFVDVREVADAWKNGTLKKDS